MADRLIRITTALTVVAVTVVAAIISYSCNGTYRMLMA